MTNEVKKITLQVRAPRGKFEGEVVEGWYVVSIAPLCSLTRPASQSTAISIIWLRARTLIC